MKNYKSEVRMRWGNTDSYREHEQKTKNYTQEKWAAVNDGLMAIFAELAACKDRGVDVTAAETVTLISNLQAYITANYEGMHYDETITANKLKKLSDYLADKEQFLVVKRMP